MKTATFIFGHCYFMEIWKEIKGYEYDYKISSYGNVISIKKGVEKLLKLQNSSGYKQIKLCIPKKIKIIRIHRLVAETFIPNPENKPQVNHINGIKSDNRVENLEWCTPKENTQHAFKNDLVNVYGENHYSSKISEEQAEYILENYKNIPIKDLSLKFKVSECCIRGIVDGSRWVRLNGNKYNIFDIQKTHLVLNTETGIYYYNSVEASKSINMEKEKFRLKITGKYKNNTPFIIV